MCRCIFLCVSCAFATKVWQCVAHVHEAGCDAWSCSNILTSCLFVEFNVLLSDNTPIQMKRLVISFVVYSLLIGSFVYLPLWCVKNLVGGWLDASSPLGPAWTSARAGALLFRALETRTHYLAPELQIPLEVGLLHTAFLMLLERSKDMVGSVQFCVLVWLSKKLGLNRFLLPYTCKRIAPVHEELTCFGDLPPAMQELYRCVTDSALITHF